MEVREPPPPREEPEQLFFIVLDATRDFLEEKLEYVSQVKRSVTNYIESKVWGVCESVICTVTTPRIRQIYRKCRREWRILTPDFYWGIVFHALAFSISVIVVLVKLHHHLPTIKRNAQKNNEDVRKIPRYLLQIGLLGLKLWIQSLRCLARQGVNVCRDLALCNIIVKTLLTSLKLEPFARSFNIYAALLEHVNLMIEFVKYLQFHPINKVVVDLFESEEEEHQESTESRSPEPEPFEDASSTDLVSPEGENDSPGAPKVPPTTPAESEQSSTDYESCETFKSCGSAPPSSPTGRSECHLSENESDFPLRSVKSDPHLPILED